MSTETPNWVYGTKSSFAAGELTPTIEGRTDLPLYQNGAKKIINWMILPSGGLTRRPGTEFIWGKQTSLSQTRLSQTRLFQARLAPAHEDEHFPIRPDAAAAADEPDADASVPTAQDLTSRLCRLRNKLDGRVPFFDYGILDREDAVYFDPQRDSSQRDASLRDLSLRGSSLRRHSEEKKD